MLQVRGIVAFEIAIDQIQAVHKMSQNRDEKISPTSLPSLKKPVKLPKPKWLKS
jgi:predicted FMN-binding regulatory protein PaiB